MIIRNPDAPLVMSMEPLEDKRLTLKAKGILCYILCQDDSYELTIADLVAHGTESREDIIAGVRELRQAGYLKLATGPDLRSHWIASDKPQH